MAIDIEDMVSLQPTENYDLGENTFLKDPDTLSKLNEETGEYDAIRFSDASGLESMQIDPETGIIKDAEYGADLQHNLLADLGQGYTTTVDSGRKGKYGRILGDAYSSDDSRSLQNRAIESGVLQASRYATRGASMLRQLEDAESHLETAYGDGPDAWDEAGALVEHTLAGRNIEVKPFATTAADYATDPSSYRGPGTVLKGRTNQNEAINWFTDDLAYGGRSVVSDFIHGLDLVTDFFSDEPGAIDEVINKRNIEDSYGTSKSHLNPFDENGDWKLDSVTDYAKFFLGNFAVSAPYMATLIASSFVPGGAYAIPSFMYSGTVYGEQEEKNIPKAIAGGIGMTVLDKFGLDVILGKQFGKQLLDSPEIQQKVIRELMKSRNQSYAEASKTLAEGIKSEMSSFSKTYKGILQDQLAGRQALQGITGRVVKGSLGEGVTEMLQEGTQMLATGNDYTSDEITQTLITAGLAGAGIGGTLSAGGGSIDYLSTRDAVKKANQTQRQQWEDVQAQELDKAMQVKTGKGAGLIARTKQEALKDLKDEARKRGFETSLEDEAKQETDRRQQHNFLSKIKEYYKYRSIIGGSIGGFLDSTYDAFSKRGDIMRTLYNSFLDSRHGNTGATGEQNTRIKADMINNETNNEAQDVNRFGMSSTALSDIIYTDQNINVWKALAKEMADPNTPYEDWVAAYRGMGLQASPEVENQLEAFLQKAEEMENFERTKSVIDGSKYEPGAFYDAYTYDKELAAELGDAIAQDIAVDINEKVEDVAAAIAEMELNFEEEYTEGGIKDKVQKKLMEDNKYAHLRRRNIHQMQLRRANGAGRKNTNENFYDQDGNDIAAILKMAEAEGEISAEERAWLAEEFKDQFQIFKNEYNQVGKLWRTTQDTMMFWSTIAMLPLATPASIVETGVIMANLSPKQQFRMFKDISKSLANEVGEYFTWIANHVPHNSKGYIKPIRYDKTKLVENALDNVVNPTRQAAALTGSLGYDDGSQSAQARLEGHSSSYSRLRQTWMNGFFRAVFLNNWTNAGRVAAAGSAADVLWGWLEEVNINGTSTEYGREAAGFLAEIGLSPQFIDKMNASLTTSIDEVTKKKKFLSTNEQLQLETELRAALINFIDGKVAMPSKSNRPKLYYDPRFQLFTHLTGYIATLTSTILPRMYKNLLRGTPGLGYGAFISIAMLFALGWFSNWLKDEIKYGGTPPWLDDEKLFQRAVYSSGLLGIFERPYDLYNPLYEQRADNWFEKYAGVAEGELPAVSWGHGITKGIGQLWDGDIDRGVANTLKATPLAPFYDARHAVGDTIEDFF